MHTRTTGEAMAGVMKMAAVLVVVGLADASCLSGIKGLFCGHAARNYKILAEHLYKTTQTSELADVTRAAESLLAKHPDANEGLVSLANAFKSLKGDPSDLESMCSKGNLANMRRVAEAMRDGGSVKKAGKATEPIVPLNLVIVKLIAHARRICPAHLDSKWPEPWEPKFSDKQMKNYMTHLWRVPDTFVYEGYMGKQEDARLDRYQWGYRLSAALQKDWREDYFIDKKLDPDCKDPKSTTNKTTLALQLREYVYKPCKEFVTLDESREVLEPYGDLMMSWNIIEHEKGKYFDPEKAPRRPPGVPTRASFNKRVKKFALAYGACKRFLVMPEEDVLTQLYKSRMDHQGRNPYFS